MSGFERKLYLTTSVFMTIVGVAVLVDAMRGYASEPVISDPLGRGLIFPPQALVLAAALICAGCLGIIANRRKIR